MRLGTIVLTDTSGHGEGHGGSEGRRTEVGDTSLRYSVLDQDIGLRRFRVNELAPSNEAADVGLTR